MTAINKKLRILAIHGYRQSDISFKAKLGALRKTFKKQIEFTFVRAPHEVPSASNNSKDNSETNGYGWWFSTQDKTFKATISSDLSVGFEESLALIESVFEESDPFDGILGFSQGAAFVSILCAMQQKNCFKSLCAVHHIFYMEKITLPTLHVYGVGDQVIPVEMAEELAELFSNVSRKIHKGGHYVPSKKDIYSDFISEMLESK
ncbi:esterase OVCA2 isoform X2 [Cephus cinctus]|uniref:Esterase OVCA2 isoform X2 n=1 Tax=Cephus cinctus TaxID=211228 RepID=A0AAJ7RCZ0_CEPCN|nr:esterase OVCA2 isoform X2 [Cephus cinctus]